MSVPNPAQRLYVGLIGPGLVGKELLRQIHARFHGPQSASAAAASAAPFSVSVVFIATSKRMACLGSATPDATLDLQADWKTLLNGEGTEAEAARRALTPPTKPLVLLHDKTDLAAALSRLSAGDVLVDCSACAHGPGEGSDHAGEDASPDGLHLYGMALAKGVSVVTPNKSFAAGPAADYERALLAVKATAKAAATGDDDDRRSSLALALSSSAHAASAREAAVCQVPLRGPTMYLGEATVGAGLPVLSTLRDLVATGDKIKKIEGIFSGSLSFIFNTLSPSSSSGGGESNNATLASVVRTAKELGFTEPDPRDDLSGLDVARKAVILSRALSLAFSASSYGLVDRKGRKHGEGAGDGFEEKLLELSDVPVRSLIPAHLSDRSAVDVEGFLSGLEKDDGGVGAEVENAKLEGKVLRYVGCVSVSEEGTVTAEVALRSLPKDNPYAGLSGADNVFSFVTERYAEASPLVIRGPGAGAAVTAAGVFGDLLTVARAAGASV